MRKSLWKQIASVPMFLFAAAALSGCPESTVPKPVADRLTPLGTACSMEPNVPASLCKGLPPVSIVDNKNAKQIAEWLAGGTLTWKDETDGFRRDNVNGPVFKIKGIYGAEHVPYLDDKGHFLDAFKKGFVLAHIDADPSAGKDNRYGIGTPYTGDEQNYQLTRDFYIVVDKLQAPDLSNGGVTLKEATIGRWQIYGIDKSTGEGRAVKVGKGGPFKICLFDHSDEELKKLGSYFAHCEPIHIADSIYQRSLKQKFPDLRLLLDTLRTQTYAVRRANGIFAAALDDSYHNQVLKNLSGFLRQLTPEQSAAVLQIVRVIGDHLDDPAWMTCGPGCCTADYPA